MKKLSTLARLFNPERLETIDPNLPENEPLLKAEAALRNQAFVQWYEGPGHYLIDALEKGLIAKVVKSIGHRRITADDRTANLVLLDEIKRDIEFIDHIVTAFSDEKKRTAPKGIPKEKK